MGVCPQFVGQTKPVGNIRFTVGQYWLIIKINGTNSVHFVRILSILWEICYLIGIFRNHSSPSTTILERFSGKFFLTTRAQSEKFGQISFRPPNFFLPVRPCANVSRTEYFARGEYRDNVLCDNHDKIFLQYRPTLLVECSSTIYTYYLASDVLRTRYQVLQCRYNVARIAHFFQWNL